MTSLHGSWREDVSGMSLAVFRMVIGAVGVLVASRYLAYGWIDTLLVEPPIRFSYPGLDWIRPWDEPWMTVHVAAMGLAALAVALGWRHRLAAATFFLLFGWIELIDRTLYINHYYWIALTALVLIALPAANRWSLDARRRGAADVPRLAVWIARFQVGMVYVFAGLAKVNADWLLRGEPLDTWLGARTDVPVVGGLLGVSLVAVGLSWAGALFDLTIVGWLSWKRTRPVAYAVLVVFHAVTWLLFPSIGVFPLVMTLGALIFFPPSWPESLVRRFGRRPSSTTVQTRPARRPHIAAAAAVAAAVYIGLMIAIPLRSSLSQDTMWSADQYQFSWRVMLTERAGVTDFRIVDPTSDETWIVDAPTGITERQASLMATDPALIVQAAHMIEDELRALGRGDIAVHADSWVSYNGRPHQRMIDPTIDLTNAADIPLASLMVPLEATG